MATLITITSAVINYFPDGITLCQLSVAVDVPTVGQTYIGRTVSLSSADLPADWSDAQLCDAVATALGVPASDVSVAAPPPPAPVVTPDPAPVDEGEGAEA